MSPTLKTRIENIRDAVKLVTINYYVIADNFENHSIADLKALITDNDTQIRNLENVTRWLTETLEWK